ncbi:MAG: hypothetical protein ACI4ET_12675 [Bilifractor sp.]
MAKCGTGNKTITATTKKSVAPTMKKTMIPTVKKTAKGRKAGVGATPKKGMKTGKTK